MMTEKLEIPEYRSRVNTDLLRSIPPDAETILEIGCGTGALYTAYQRINQFCTWYGIEKDTEARVAAGKTGLKIIGDDAEAFFEDARSTWSKDHEVDCLIAGDCLEHLIDPWTILKNAVRCVKPSGQVIACIPNMGHFSVIVSLLQGNWPYADEGLFDRGHLRQFTLTAIRDMFVQAGLQIFDVRGRCFGNEHHPEFMHKIREFGGWAGIDLERLDRQSRVLQYLIRAIKPSLSPAVVSKVHIHCIVAEPCCARPRIIEPMNMLGTIPGVQCSIGRFGAEPQPNQIFIQQRYRGVNLEIQRILINDGLLIICEIDDDPRALEGVSDNDFMSLRSTHAIQCSTEPLAEVCRQFNPHVQVFPNQIAELPPPRVYSDVPHPVKIFFGCQNRESDWSPIMPALNRVLNDYTDVQMIVVHDEKFFHALAINPDRKMFYPWQDYPEYRALLRTCDIALLLLEPIGPRGMKHAMKSDIGFIEAAAEGVTVLASETVYFVPIYTGHRCVKGMIYGSPSQFMENLETLITCHELRRTMAKAAYEYVKCHRMLGQHYQERLTWYRELLTRKLELDQSLRDRAPELQLML
jgi:SAM-dependent methyltransferase